MPSRGAHSLALTSLSFRSAPWHSVRVAVTISRSTILGARFCGILLQKFIKNTLSATHYQQSIYHQRLITALSANNISTIIQSKFTDKFKNCPGVPLEDKRCQVSIDDIEKKFKYFTRRNWRGFDRLYFQFGWVGHIRIRRFKTANCHSTKKLSIYYSSLFN